MLELLLQRTDSGVLLLDGECVHVVDRFQSHELSLQVKQVSQIFNPVVLQDSVLVLLGLSLEPLPEQLWVTVLIIGLLECLACGVEALEGQLIPPARG